MNAPVPARERGVEILESREPRDRDYVNRISVEITYSGGASLRMDGTCFGRRPRLVELDGVPLDAELDGDLLVTRHGDRPGMVGRIGTLLGERGVNIDRVDLGALPRNGSHASPSQMVASQMAASQTVPLAVGVFGVSGELDDGALAAVRSVDGVASACLVRFPTIR